MRHRRPEPAPVVANEEEELELARQPRRRGRTLPPPDSDFVRSGLHRKSPWKLALALSAALILPVGGFALLVRLRMARRHRDKSPPRRSPPCPRLSAASRS